MFFVVSQKVSDSWDIIVPKWSINISQTQSSENTIDSIYVQLVSVF